MRILGGHDYYDTALTFGRDETLVFVRSTSEKAKHIKPDDAFLRIPRTKRLKFKDTYHDHFSRDNVDYTAIPRILWFAGQRYGAVQVVRNGRGPGNYGLDDLWFWDGDRFADFLISMNVALRDPRKGSDPGDSINTANIGEFFTGNGRASEREWLVEHGLSIALLDFDRWTRDETYFWKVDADGLKNIHFQRRLGPYEAFQALSQWVGGVLPRPGSDMVVIRDEKTMLSKHGMDHWSFRKPPETA